MFADNFYDLPASTYRWYGNHLVQKYLFCVVNVCSCQKSNRIVIKKMIEGSFNPLGFTARAINDIYMSGLYGGKRTTLSKKVVFLLVDGVEI